MIGDPSQICLIPLDFQRNFNDPVLGKVAPYGVYDMTTNTGWVNVGIGHDTADGGGSNGYRVRLWRRELQQLANDLSFPVQVCHFPPGTSKWNKIEHRMFCHITANWRGRPLVIREVVVNLIAGTTTREGLKIQAGLDENAYEAGIKGTDEGLASLSIERDSFHGEWNYRINPQGKT